MIRPEREASARSAHPIVFLVLILPFGAMAGYLSVAVGYLLSRAGLTVEAIAGLVRSLTSTAESRQQVRDRALSSRVRAALAAHPDTRKYRLSVDSDRGVIRLEGTAALERAADVARTVPGVVDVKSQLLEVPPIPPFVA